VINFTAQPIYPRKKPGTYYIGGFLGTRAGLNAVEKRRSLTPAEKRTPAVQTVTKLTELPRVLKM
jgi:hypothetical protein